MSERLKDLHPQLTTVMFVHDTLLYGHIVEVRFWISSIKYREDIAEYSLSLFLFALGSWFASRFAIFGFLALTVAAAVIS